jgi:hypothetical protein
LFVLPRAEELGMGLGLVRRGLVCVWVVSVVSVCCLVVCVWKECFVFFAFGLFVPFERGCRGVPYV